MPDPAPQPPHLAATFRRIGQSLLGLGLTRVQLFALEWETERLRLLETLCWLALGLGVGGLGLAIGTVALALFLWDSAGLAGLLALAGVLVGTALVLLWVLWDRLRHAPSPFAETVAEFEKDRACLHDNGSGN